MRRCRHSTSSSFAFDQPSSSHLNDDDNYGNDDGTSRASTPSPIRYVNSLTDQVPQVFQNPPNIDPHLEPFYTPPLSPSNSLPKSPPNSPIFDTTPLPPSPNSSNPTSSFLPPQISTQNHIDSNKPPDPILEEFCTLTGISSSNISHNPFVPNSDASQPKARGRPKGVKNHIKSVKIKVQSPGSASAGAGAILKRLRNSKMVSKGRSRGESSPLDESNGKRSNSCNNLVDEVLSKVLDRISYDKSINSQMVFKEGHSNGVKFVSRDPPLVSNDISKPTMAGVEHDRVESIRKANEDGMEVVNDRSAFVFGDVKRNKGILNRPAIGLTKVQFGPSLFYKANSVWSSSKYGVNALNVDGSKNIKSFAENMKRGMEDRELQRKYVPEFVSKKSDGVKRISISVEDIKKGSEACALKLYGYFVETSMDYRVVNANLSRMWRVYGIADITKTSAGLFYFKFKNKERMKAVLECGPWMINNVPLVLNVWEPVMNGNGIGKIISGIGKPMLMDKLTKERCLKNSGKLDFARDLVEVSADDELPLFLEIEYPVVGDRPARIGKLVVKYQLKPPQCLHCKTFGHSTVACKIRPRTKEEIAAKVLKEALKVNKYVGEMDGGVKAGDDDFTTIGKKNKPVVMQSMDKLNANGMGGNAGHVQKGSSNGKLGNASACSIKNLGQNVDSSPGLVLKPPLSSKYNDNVVPKVLIRGSGFSKAVDSLADNVPVSNSFQALDDHDMVDKEDNVLNSMDEEYLKLDFFYNNCPKYGIEPYVDDEVESDNEGMAVEMKPINEDEVVPDVVNGGTNENNSLMNLKAFSWNVRGLNNDFNQKQEWFSNASSCDSGTGIVVGWDPNAVKIMLHSPTSQVMNVIVEAVSDAPWVLLCDFNVILDPSERSFGSSSVNSGMEEFRKYISRIEVYDLVMSQYTWNKSPKSTNSILKKLDRVMCNMGFLDKFLNSNAVFLPF
ncbi:RNA-directed DNA polymerase, eukaryota, reverse transcriptase zinc-binding domain protein, partial [Tanacetum coccineum]